MSNFFLKKTLTTPPKKQTKEKTENKTKHNIKKKTLQTCYSILLTCCLPFCVTIYVYIRCSGPRGLLLLVLFLIGGGQQLSKEC